jgi:hypothetical protein
MPSRRMKQTRILFISAICLALVSTILPFGGGTGGSMAAAWVSDCAPGWPHRGDRQPNVALPEGTHAASEGRQRPADFVAFLIVPFHPPAIMAALCNERVNCCPSRALRFL